jgi:hypothetical protein
MNIKEGIKIGGNMNFKKSTPGGLKNKYIIHKTNGKPVDSKGLIYWLRTHKPSKHKKIGI